MIETEEQRRWWFATHPEFSWSRTGQRSKKASRHEDDESDKLSPEAVDAAADESLKYEKDHFLIGLLKDIKFWFGTAFALKSAAEKHALLWGDDESAGSEDNPQVAEGLQEEVFIKELTNAGWSREWAESRWKLIQRDENIARGVTKALLARPAGVLGFVLQELGEAIGVPISNVAGKLRSWARLPPKGTRERSKIEMARKRGIDAKKAQERASIKAGGKGSGVWSEKELAEIRRTGDFPIDAQWHHNPTVANRPDLAADPSVVRVLRGGRKGHLRKGHFGHWGNPKE